MALKPLDDVIRNIDTRLEHVEQILPTLATKDGLQEAVARLATKDELREAVARLATKDELRDVVAQLATKAELREEGERTRRHFDVVAERLERHVRLVAEAQDAHRDSTDRRFEDVRADIAQLDRRVTRLESKRR